VYVGLSGTTSRLFARALDSFEVRPLPGTEGAIHPFFSPDGRSVGFLTNSQLKIHSLAAGTTTAICDVVTGVVATWTADDQVLFVSDEGRRLQRVSARGGVPVVLAEPLEGYQYGRAMLDGSHALITYRLDGISNDYAQVLLLDIATGVQKRLPINGYDARFLPSGHMVFGRSGRAFVVGFDFAKLEVVGEPQAIASGVRMHSLYPHMQLAVSNVGSLVYVPGGDVSVASFTWYDRNRAAQTLPIEPRVYGAFDLSDDGRYLAAQTADNRDYILVYDLQRNTSRRIAASDSAGWPKWSPSAEALAFTTFGEGRPYRIEIQQMDSDRPPVAVAESAARPTARVWTTDGRLTFYEFPNDRLAFVNLVSGSPAGPVRYQTYRASNHDVSGDGRWLVYADSASALNIRLLEVGERVRRIAEAGVEPVWCRTCDELVYRSGNRWFSSRLHVGDDVEWEPPQLVLETDFVDSPGQSWALSADGQRILVLKSTATLSRTKLNVIGGWLTVAAAAR
jgi:Tol biopolymer transport system component